jgi:hypothetical protein
MPAWMAERLKDDAGLGVSKAAEDNLVPAILLLQKLSPQVDKTTNEYVEGAEAGMFWLKNSPVPLVSGEEGLLVQPCFTVHDHREWRPRASGGGFIRTHAQPPADAVEKADPQNPSKIRLTRPNGNEVIETRSMAMRVKLPSGIVLPYMMAFTSTGHTVIKGWNTLMLNVWGPAPCFARWYRLTTRQRTNAQGTWFTVVVVDDQSWVEDSDYKAGHSLHEAFATGKKQAEAPTDSQSGAARDDDEIPF